MLFVVRGERFGGLGGHLEQEVLVRFDVDGCEVAVPSPGVAFVTSWAVGCFAWDGTISEPMSGATDQAVACDDRDEFAGRGRSAKVEAWAGRRVRGLETEVGHRSLLWIESSSPKSVRLETPTPYAETSSDDVGTVSERHKTS